MPRFPTFSGERWSTCSICASTRSCRGLRAGAGSPSGRRGAESTGVHTAQNARKRQACATPSAKRPISARFSTQRPAIQATRGARFPLHLALHRTSFQAALLAMRRRGPTHRLRRAAARPSLQRTRLFPIDPRPIHRPRMHPLREAARMRPQPARLFPIDPLLIHRPRMRPPRDEARTRLHATRLFPIDPLPPHRPWMHPPPDEVRTRLHLTRLFPIDPLSTRRHGMHPPRISPPEMHLR